MLYARRVGANWESIWSRHDQGEILAFAEENKAKSGLANVIVMTGKRSFGIRAFAFSMSFEDRRFSRFQLRRLGSY